MKVIRNLNQVLLALLVVPVMMGCSKETDEDKVGDAQFCLDDIPISGLSVTERSSKINSCLGKMSSVNTKQANLIRCASGFMIEGFADPAKLIDIAEQMSSSNNQNPTTALMSILTFKSSGTSESATSEEDKTFATSTFDYCNATGSSGYIFIASISSLATNFAFIADSFGILNPDGTPNIQGLLENPGAAAAVLESSDEVIGLTAIAAAQASCTADNSSDAICQQLNTAINSNSDPADIGAALRATWASQ